MDAGEGGFVADQEGQGRGAVGEAAEEPGLDADIVDFGKLAGDIISGVDALVIEELGFDGGNAAEAPAGDGDGVDELGFDGIGGIEAVDIGVEECFEVVIGFVPQDGEFRGEAVAECVARGFRFTFVGDGTLGFGSVDARGFGFIRHTGF